jgi:hypothetical protein
VNLWDVKTNGSFGSELLPVIPTHALRAKSTPFNVLLVSDNYIVTLNSELFIRCLLNNHFVLKGGASNIFTEYTTDI